MAVDHHRNPIIPLNGLEDSRRALLDLLQGVRRTLCLYAPLMRADLYNDPEVLTVLRHRIATQPKIRFYGLLPPVSDWRSTCPGLMRLCERLTTALLVRTPNRQELPDWPELGQTFAIADDQALLRFSDPRRLIGEAVSQPNERTKELLERFRTIWDRSEPDPTLRTVGL